MAPVAQLVLGLLSPLTSTIPYTDSLVAPVPASHYVRYVTFLATGTRTFTCDPSNATSKYTLASFDYDLYDAEADPSTRKLSLGKHVLMTNRNPDGGNSVFYTANDTFTYWVGKTTMTVPDPRASSPLDLTLEQELRTEASEPKAEAGKYDLGGAVYATRFGAVGGNLPKGEECTGDRTVRSETYYSIVWQVL